MIERVSRQSDSSQCQVSMLNVIIDVLMPLSCVLDLIIPASFRTAKSRSLIKT